MDPVIRDQIVEALKIFLRNYNTDPSSAWNQLSNIVEPLGYFINRQLAVDIGLSTGRIANVSAGVTTGQVTRQIGFDEFPVGNFAAGVAYGNTTAEIEWSSGGVLSD